MNWTSEAHVTVKGFTRTLRYRPGTSDLSVLRQTFTLNELRMDAFPRFPEIAKFVETRLMMGVTPMIVDCGAYIGATAIFYALNHQGCKVIALEPDADNYALLCENTNGLGVEPIRAGVSCAAGMGRVHLPPDADYAKARFLPQDDGDVPFMSINDIYRQRSAMCPFLVKADIEGGEHALFDANLEWFVKTPIVVVELHDWLFPKQGTSFNFIAALHEFGDDRDLITQGEYVYSIAHDLHLPWDK